MSYHIKKDGTPDICRAKPGNCPLGGDENHFPTKEEAQDYADKKNELEVKQNKINFGAEEWEKFRKEIIENEEKKNTVPYFNENEIEEIYKGIKYSTVDYPDNLKKEIKSIKILNFNQEEIQDEIDFHLNRSEDRKYESLCYYTHEILNDKSMLGNEDNEYINTLRKELGKNTNKIIQPERSFEDTVSNIISDNGLSLDYEYDYKDKEKREKYINAIKSEFKPKFEINGEKFYVGYAEGKGNFFNKLNKLIVKKYENYK